jgi:hypothetical protein
MKAPEMLKTLKAGKSLAFTGLDNKEFSVKLKPCKFDLFHTLIFYRENKCLNKATMTDSQILIYLEQYEKTS